MSGISSEVRVGCGVGRCVVPFQKGTDLFILFSTLHIVQHFRHRKPPIQVHSPFPTNEQIPVSPQAIYSNIIDFDGSTIDYADERRSQLQRILTVMASNDPHTYFCIVPIRLSNMNNTGTHSNTLIIWRESDRLKAFIVEPQGFYQDPYNYMNIYFEKIQDFLGVSIILLNNNEAFYSEFKSNFREDICQGGLQKDVEFAIDSEVDTTLVTKSMCATLSAVLTKKIIERIQFIKKTEIFTYPIFGCSGLEYFEHIHKLNTEILSETLLTFIQLLETFTNFHYTRGHGEERSQIAYLSPSLTGITDTDTDLQTKFSGILALIKQSIEARGTFHKYFAATYLQQIFDNFVVKKLPPDQIITLKTDGFHFPTTVAQASPHTTALKLKPNRMAQKTPFTAGIRTPHSAKQGITTAGKRALAAAQIKRGHSGGYRKTRKRKQKMKKRTRKQTQKRYRKRTKNLKSSKKNKRRTK